MNARNESVMPAGLAKLREPFPANLVNKLPKGTKAQNECAASEKVNCKVCGGWHHPKIIHLDYVGHAALTDRLLDADPLWSWEPLACRDGLPAFDESGGLWIKLTVCGHTRIGYGHAAASSYKDIGAREKEVIGDALRNAAMRFGAALDLWHKGDLHGDEAPPKTETEKPASKPPVKAALEGVVIPDAKQAELKALAMDLVHYVEACSDVVTATNLLMEAGLNSDETLFLWDVLQPNSATRSAIKKEKAGRASLVGAM